MKLKEAINAIRNAIEGTGATVCIDENTFDGNTRIEWNNIAVEVSAEEAQKVISAIKVLDDLGSRSCAA